VILYHVLLTGHKLIGLRSFSLHLLLGHTLDFAQTRRKIRPFSEELRRLVIVYDRYTVALRSETEETVNI
jgi:hypothetical protein